MKAYLAKFGVYPPSPNLCCTGGEGGTHHLSFESMAAVLVKEGFLPSIPKAPTSNNPYMNFDYGPGSTAGSLLVTYLENINDTTVPPLDSCRPFVQNWCSTDMPSKAYCLCNTVPTQPTQSSPTATLTINGRESDTISVGDPYQYSWSSTNADTFGSNYSATCTNGAAWSDAWSADNAQGSASGTISPDAAGCTYTVNYKATQSATGKESSAQVTVIVRAMTSAERLKYSNLAGVGTSFMFGGKDKVPAAQSAVTPKKSLFTYHFTQNLSYGSKGTEVQALQEALREERLFTSELSGNFYDKTREAVMAFQAKYGISQVGSVGPETRAQLNALFAQ